MEPRVLEVIDLPIISLAEFKLYAKIDEDADDTLIPLLIDAATSACERYTGLFFRKKRVEHTFERSAAEWRNHWKPKPLPYGPMQKVESVSQWKSGAWEVLDANQYTIEGQNWVSVNTTYSFRLSEYGIGVNQYKVVYTAGYHETDVDPTLIYKLDPDLKLAVMMLATEMYQNRQVTLAGTIVATLDVTHKTLLNPYRQRTLF